MAAPLEESAQRGSGLRLLQAIRPVSGDERPQALGYTRIAGMPVVTLPLAAFAALGSVSV